MNKLQYTNQIVSTLLGAKWQVMGPAGMTNGEQILTRVAVSPATPDFFKRDAVSSFALVHPEESRDTAEHPADLIQSAKWSIYIFAANATDQAGGAAVTGGNRVDLASSRGRGLFEIEPYLRSQLFDSLVPSARIITSGSQPVSPAGRLEGLVAELALEVVTGLIPGLPDFTPVRQLTGAGGGGNVNLAWAAPPSRYDIVGFTWVRVPGGAAPTTPAGGTFVSAASGASQVALADSPGAGTWSYAIFWAYDTTVDPFTGTGVVPVAPNAWSSWQLAQTGLQFNPATITVNA